MSYGFMYCANRGRGCEAHLWVSPTGSRLCPECEEKRAAEAAVRAVEALPSAAEEVTHEMH